MDERRKEKRFQQENKVFIQTEIGKNDSDSDSEFDALTHDICLGGARILTKNQYSTGTTLRVQIDLSHSHRILSVDAEVRWVRELEESDLYEIGVEFQHEIPKTVLFLIAHLYGEQEGVPTNVSMSK